MLKISAKTIIAKYIKHKFFDGNEISEKELASILREIRIALLNSDVNLEVIKSFFAEIKEELLVRKNYNKQDKADVIVLATIKKKLIEILGEKALEIPYSPNKLNKVLVLGLNGSGKTTTTAKLALHIQKKHKAKVKAISLDIYRPGAFEQLKQLCDPVNISTFKVESEDFKQTIKSHIASTEQEETNCIFFDNYGLLADNEELLNEVESIKKLINPTETLFIVDAMAGQDILETVRIFHERFGITGIVVSKTDSNAPMGGVFSISYLLKIPIKYMGKGEGINDLTPFYPERIASLILGEGDILSLAEQIEQNADIDASKKLFARLAKGQFDLDDLISQIKEMRKIGSLKSLLKMFPIQLPTSEKTLDNAEQQLKIWEILISSMTRKERKNPKLFKKQPNRKLRVIKGSGRKPDELNKLLKKWEESKKKLDEISSSIQKGKNPLSFLMGR